MSYSRRMSRKVIFLLCPHMDHKFMCLNVLSGLWIHLCLPNYLTICYNISTSLSINLTIFTQSFYHHIINYMNMYLNHLFMYLSFKWLSILSCSIKSTRPERYTISKDLAFQTANLDLILSFHMIFWTPLEWALSIGSGVISGYLVVTQKLMLKCIYRSITQVFQQVFISICHYYHLYHRLTRRVIQGTNIQCYKTIIWSIYCNHDATAVWEEIQDEMVF